MFSLQWPTYHYGLHTAMAYIPLRHKKVHLPLLRLCQVWLIRCVNSTHMTALDSVVLTQVSQYQARMEEMKAVTVLSVLNHEFQVFSLTWGSIDAEYVFIVAWKGIAS